MCASSPIWLCSGFIISSGRSSHVNTSCFFLNKSLHFGIASSLKSSSNEAKQSLAVRFIISAACFQFSLCIHLLKLSTTSEKIITLDAWKEREQRGTSNHANGELYWGLWTAIPRLWNRSELCPLTGNRIFDYIFSSVWSVLSHLARLRQAVCSLISSNESCFFYFVSGQPCQPQVVRSMWNL